MRSMDHNGITQPGLLAIALLAWWGLPAHAQIVIIEEYKHSWSENAGWMNWRDASAGLDGVMVHQTFLSGWIWFENAGWTTVGDGSPGNGVSYLNANGLDHGVNMDALGDLSGFAWSENAGWISFDTVAALGGEGLHARYDRVKNRFFGYAWSENLGWINLDDAEHYVAAGCPGDCDADGGFTIFDFLCFQGLVAAGSPAGDCNDDGGVDIFDYLCFQGLVTEGCGE